MGGSQRFCVQCGHELEPGLRSCVACGGALYGAGSARIGSDQVTAAGGYGATPIMPAFTREGVASARPSAEPTWPSKGSYQPTEVSTRPASDDFSRPTASPIPASESFSHRPDRFTPSPGRPPRDQRSRGPRSRRPLTGLITVLLPAVIAAAVAFLLLGPSRAVSPGASAAQTGAGNQGTAPASAASPPVSTLPSASPARVSEQQAASNLAGLLSQSVKDRSAVMAAVTDVNSCGPALSQDPQTFQNAATSRQQLLSQLASLSGRSALPAAMLQSLTGAWQASAAADQDLGKWAQDEVSKGCTPNDQADASFQAAMGPDGQATADKKAFVGQWNTIASQYGLTNYQWNQL